MENLKNAIRDMPHIPLATLPTPLHKIANMGNHLGIENLYIKRDDMTGVGPGGNKVRSLEFLLGEAIKEGCSVVIASGPVQSNLCTLTAACCAKIGMKCILVHNGNKPTELEGNQLLNYLISCEAHFIGDVSSEKRNEYVEKLFNELEASGEKTYIIKNGASTGTGALGYVQAAMEILEQCQNSKIPIKTIFAPGGNGGVASGLVYGNAVLGLPFDIKIISVEDSKAVLSENMERIIKEIEEKLGIKIDKSLNEICEVNDDYRGQGWGVDTKESRDCVEQLPKLEGIFIENVYNSKVLVGIMDYAKQGKIKENVCYLHTGGFGSLFSQY